MRAYLVELRYSPLRWWLPVLIIVDLATLFGRNHSWIGEWPQTTVAAQIAAFYFAPVLAAAAAWAAGRTCRHKATALVEGAARAPWKIELAQLTATVTYGLIAYGVGVVVAAVVTSQKASSGFLWPSYLILGVELLVGFSAAGHLVGHWWNAPFSAPAVSGLASFITIAWIGSPTRLGFFVLNGSPFYAVPGNAIAARAALALCITLAAVALRKPSLARYARSWRAPQRIAAQCIICAALIASFIGLRSAGSIQQLRAIPSHPSCTKGVPSICLWPEDAKYLPEAQGMAKNISQLEGFGLTAPSGFYERGIRGPEHGFEDFYILDGSMWDASITIAGEVTESSVPKDCPRLIPQERLTEAFLTQSGELSMWATMRVFGAGQPADMHGGPPGVDLNSVAQVITWSQTQQAAWVQQRMDTIHHAYCG